jgi:enterobacterial common antigen flippase
LNSNDKKNSYGQALKSSALVGGSSLVTMVLRFVRSKVIAVVLKEGGFGLLGLYNPVSDLTRTIAGLGINYSGVRQIAEVAHKGNQEQIAKTVTALRRLSMCSGALGGIFLLLFCVPVSRMTFGNSDHARDVALLGLAVLFLDVSAGQAALVQGMRRVADLARMNILGAIYGTVLTVPIICIWKEKGLVPSLICVAGMSILTSWWYARKIKVERVKMTWRDITGEARELLRLGLVFTATGLFTMAAQWVIPVIIRHKLDVNHVGFYVAAWSLSGYGVNFVLQAMGTDFYPRLTGVANNHSECNRLVNEQVEIGILIGGPGVMAMLSFAPVLMTAFYSDRFTPAATTFNWICLGMFMRVISWPLGFVLVARGERKLYFWTELLSNAAWAAAVWFGVNFFQLEGAGMAFFALHLGYATGMYFVVKRLTGFSWTPASVRLLGVFFPLVGVVFGCRFFLGMIPATLAGGVITVAIGIYSLRMLCTLIPVQKLPRLAQKLLVFFRMASLDAAA